MFVTEPLSLSISKSTLVDDGAPVRDRYLQVYLIFELIKVELALVYLSYCWVC